MEVYKLTKGDLEKIEDGKEVLIITKDNHNIVLKLCDCEDCKEED